VLNAPVVRSLDTRGHSLGVEPIPCLGGLAYTEEQVVSSDFISDPHSSIYGASAGLGLSDRFFKVVAWYDNEMGYACRCVDMLKFMASKETAGAAGAKSAQAVGA
jgi:glyceraldehyde-3-phosphate dehydrogenase/erythrose-4-phosphate dehydrogenase